MDTDGEKHSHKRSHAHDVEVGLSIRRHRKAAKMSMKVLGDRLGISYQQVQKYERGLNRISAGRLMELADILNVPVSHFFAAQVCAEGDPLSSTPLLDRDAAEEDPQAVEAFLLVKAFFKIDDPARRLDALSYVRTLADPKAP